MQTMAYAMAKVEDGEAREHRIKCWPAYFRELQPGKKNFEVRKDDRGYQKGDVLTIEEYDPETGKKGSETCALITYVLPGGQFGIEAGYVVLGLDFLDDEFISAGLDVPNLQ